MESSFEEEEVQKSVESLHMLGHCNPLVHKPVVRKVAAVAAVAALVAGTLIVVHNY